MPGPPKKPTAQKILEGNPGKYPLPKNEPKLHAAIPTMPVAVGRDVVARIEWEDITSLLFEHGMITSIDGKAIAIYCLAFSEWTEARAVLEENGKTQVSERTGFELKSPWIAIRDKADDVMRRMLAEFGMTPASRTKVTAATKAKTRSTGYAALTIRKKSGA